MQRKIADAFRKVRSMVDKPGRRSSSGIVAHGSNVQRDSSFTSSHRHAIWAPDRERRRFDDRIDSMFFEVCTSHGLAVRVIA